MVKLVHLGDDIWVVPDHVVCVKGFDPDEEDDHHVTYIYFIDGGTPLVVKGVAADIVAALEGDACN